MEKIILLLVLILSLVGCATIKPSPTELESDTGYVAGYFSEYSHRIIFQNLDSGEKKVLYFRSSEDLYISPIPLGRWTVVELHGSTGQSSMTSSIPLALKTIIEIEENTIIFLGSFSYSKPKYSPFNISSGTSYFDYPFESFLSDLESEINTPPGMAFKPLRRLTM